MERIKFLLVILIILFTQQAFAQKVSNVDFDDIKAKTHDSTSVYYYPFLLKRFQIFDTTLTSIDLNYIYYGNVFDPTYNPYNESKDEEKFKEFVKAKKYVEAIPFGISVFNENPVNMKVLHDLIVCYDKTGNQSIAQKYANRYFSLLDVIYRSGNGMGLNTAYVVIKVPDEYEILGDMGLQITKQTLVQDVDVLTINTKLQTPAKGEKKVKELHFNVRMPLLHLHQQFKTESKQ